MPNKWHADTATQAGSAQFADSSGNLVGKATGTSGSLRVLNGVLLLILPTSDPGVTGAIWNNGGTLAISA